MTRTFHLIVRCPFCYTFLGRKGQLNDKCCDY
nr:MAG TPA: protein of unknown function (DUF1922) [Caudoviricetes sp.]